MICGLCQEREADKKNTHYLTDGIIRSCLNYDGGNGNQQGYYADLSSNKEFPEFNFQRGTSQIVLEDGLGRIPTEEEIEKAKKIPFSVDFVFCTQCENFFGKIEEPFLTKLLPKFREADLTGIQLLSFEDSTPFRLFFLLQLWRSSVCEPDFNLSKEIKERLRQLILNPDKAELKMFPLMVTYLITIGDKKDNPSEQQASNQMAYTNNVVGFLLKQNHTVILMNDFMIEFSEKWTEPNFNQERLVNYKEGAFIVKVISNDVRLRLMENLRASSVEQFTNTYRAHFIQSWIKIFNYPPPTQLIIEYSTKLVDWEHIPQAIRMSHERVNTYTIDFINGYLTGKKK